jgi:hypothetical protein
MCDELTNALNDYDQDRSLNDYDQDLEGLLTELNLNSCADGKQVNATVESLAKSLALKLRKQFGTDSVEEVRTEAALKRCAKALACAWLTHVSLSNPHREILLRLSGAFAGTVMLTDDGPLAQIHMEAWLLGAESVLKHIVMEDKRTWFREFCSNQLLDSLAEAVELSCSALRADKEDAQLAQRLAAAGRIMFFLFDASQVLRSPRAKPMASANDGDKLFMRCVKCISFSTLCSFLKWLRERCAGELGGDLETLEDQPGLSWLERRLHNWAFFLLVNVCTRFFRVPQNVADTAPMWAPITVDAVHKAAHETAEAVLDKYPRALPGTRDAEAVAKGARYAKLFGVTCNDMPQLPPERAAEPPAQPRGFPTVRARVVPDDDEEAHGRDHKRARPDGVASTPGAPGRGSPVHQTVRHVLIPKSTEPPSQLSLKPLSPAPPLPTAPPTPTPTAPQQLPVQPQDPLQVQREAVLRRIADMNSRFRALLAGEVARLTARYRQPA